jgi:hypothetical protein
LYANQTSKYLEVNFTSLAEGNHTFTAYTQDLAGNVNSTSHQAISGGLLYDCYNITIPGTYTLQNSVTFSTPRCFDIKTDNVVLDLNSNTIDGNSKAGWYGVYLDGYNNFTIKNGDIDYTGTALYMANTDSSKIEDIDADENDEGYYLNNFDNGAITGSGTMVENCAYTGISLSGNGNTISDMIVTDIDTSFGGYDGLELTGNNNFINSGEFDTSGFGNGITLTGNNNTITSVDNDYNYQYGLYVIGDNNTINGSPYFYDNGYNAGSGSAIRLEGDNNIVDLDSGSEIGSFGRDFTTFDLYDADNNTITFDGTIYASENIYLTNSNNNRFVGFTLDSEGSEISIISSSDNNNFTNITFASSQDVYLTSSTNNIFLNVTYDASNEIVDGTSSLIKRWYYRAYVNDTGGLPVNNAQVTVYSVDGTLRLNRTTAADGYTQVSSLTEYVNNGGTRQYYNNYSMYSKESAFNVYHSFNITTNTLENVFTETVTNTYSEPSDENTSSYTIESPVFTTLSDNVKYNADQNLTFVHPTHGKTLKVEALFDSSSVDLSDLTIVSDEKKTVVNTTGASGISPTHSIYVPRYNDVLIYVCPDAETLSEMNPSCSGKIEFTYDEMESGTWKSNIYGSLEGGYYVISNITGSGAGVDNESPSLSFISPQDSSFTAYDHIFTNVSSSDNSTHYTFVDLDDSLIAWYRMDDLTSVYINDTYEDESAIDGSWWSGGSNVTDEDWNTWDYVDLDSGIATVYINYTIPSNTNNTILWQIRDSGGYANLTINDTCYSYASKLVLKVESDFDMSQIRWYCYDGSWQTLRTYTNTPPIVYEEEIIWNITRVMDYLNNNEGIINGDAIQENNGSFGKGFSFDGDGDYISIDQPGLGQEITLSGWFYLDDFTSIWNSPFGNFNHGGGSSGFNFVPRNGQVLVCVGDGLGYGASENCGSNTFASTAVKTNR